MKRIVSGIQPTSGLTLGNYLGSIKQFIELQNNYEMFIFVADLHSLTTNSISPQDLYNNSKNLVKSYLACGLNPDKVNLFLQSSILEQPSLGYILMCQTTLGELNRMTQFKDKTSKMVKESNGTQKLPTGLLIYPALMAADILIYSPDLVPVGSDQKQHIELTRDIAVRMNNKYKNNLFKIPDILTTKNGSKIMDLTNTSCKMSKSASSHKGVIFLNDPIEVSVKKILSAKTDSLNKVNYDKNQQPEVANLIDIYSCISKLNSDEITEKYKDKGYKEFKEDLAKLLEIFLNDYQNKYNEITDEKISEVLEKGYKNAIKIASPKYVEISKALGIYKNEK